MNSQPTKPKLLHSISSKNREEMEIMGVEDVISFDDKLADILTSEGKLTVEGTGLHVTLLDIENNKMSLSGKIDAIIYSDKTPKNKKGLFGKNQ